MPFQKEFQIYHNFSLIFFQEIRGFLQKISQQLSLILKKKPRNETFLKYLNEEKSIAIEEINLDAEWKNIFNSEKSTPIFILTANSV